MEFTVSQIALLLGGEIQGDGDRKISMLAKIQEAKNGEISFLSNPKYEPYIYETK
ncbi:MAG: LpxD N-terminal domain-containing protein, partial [Fulvivirga sp.]